MDIGINNLNFYKTSIEHSPSSLKQLKKIGFDTLDYPIYGEWNFPNVIYNNAREHWVNYFKEERKIIEGEGLKTFQTHATFRSDFDQENFGSFSQKVVDQLKKEIETTAILGAKYVVIHPMHNMDVKSNDYYYQKNIEAFEKLTPFLKEFNVVCALENLFELDGARGIYDDTWYTCPSDLLKYLDALDQDSFCACLDTGHSNLVGSSPAYAARKLGSKLKVLHVSDNYAKKDIHMPIGIGNTDWNDFANALKEIGYNGSFNLELVLYPLAKLSQEALWKMVEFAYQSAKDVVDKIK